MRITQKLTFAAALLALSLPVTALAAPGNVSGVQAAQEADGIHVAWDGVDSAVSYKIFWSRESILDNNALYDDMVETKSVDTTYVLKNLPQMNDVYVTVLAVDKDGQESPLFNEEAHVTLKNGPTLGMVNTASSSSMSSSSASVAPMQNAVDNALAGSGLLRALKVDVLSPTSLLITFSSPIVLTQQTARTAFTVTDAQNQRLPISQIRTDGTGATLTTAQQAKNHPYRLHIDPSVKGLGVMSGSVLTLDPEQTDLLFLGDPSSTMTAPATPSGSVGDVTSVQVQAAVDGRNTYTVQIAWQPPQGVQVMGYRVSQTRDGGQTFSQPQMLPNTTQVVQMPKTPAGDLGLLIQVVDQNQNVSRGVLQRVVLPQTSGSVAATVTPGSTIGKNTRLPQTGVGTVSLLAMAGAAAGAQLQRRKKKRA